MQTRSGQTKAMTWPAGQLALFLDGQCEAVIDLTLQLARDRGFTDQTSAVRSAWTESARYINESLVAYLSHPLRRRGIDGHNDYRQDPRFEKLRRVAQRHHDVGVPLDLHNGLFKLYRKAYVRHFSALLCEARKPDADDVPVLENPPAFLDGLDDFFDELDLAMLTPWAEKSFADLGLADSLRRLTRERDQYLAALESLRDPVFLTSEDGKLVSANRAALQVFLDLAEAGAFTYRLALQPHRARLQAIVDEILGTGGSEWTAIWMQTVHGNRCFDIVVRKVEDSSGKLDRRKIILMHDVTEHYRAVQKANEAERTMSLFLAAMSHEIRAPLHSVLGAADLIKSCAREDIGRWIDLLDISARSLSATLDNVLSFSRFSHQAPKPRPDNVALHRELTDLIRVHGIRARQLGVPLHVDIAPAVPHHVCLDWSMTRQILSNVIQNALRYDDGQGVRVKADVEAETLVFRICDHGPGMPAEICAMLTDVPAELRPRATERNGSGLGLAIAQRMTLALGGRICALDCADGALVEVRLPLVPGQPEVRPESALPRDEALDMSCLVVDDDPINAQVTVAMLERLGLGVDHAESIAQAHALCSAAPDAYDIFMIDYRLPDGSGVDFARQLHQDPRRRDAAIFLLSANVDWVRQTPEDARLFTALLRKPLDTTSLAQAVRAGMRARAPADMLDGLSAEARQRMAAVFARSWSNFHAALSVTDSARRSDDIAARAHKLASGARIFGLTGMADALLGVEHSHTSPEADAALRHSAHESVLACALPTDWSERTGDSQT